MNKKIRNSNIETLRILCIVAIIASHYVFHGGNHQQTIINNLSGNILFLQFIGNFSKSACSLFAITTGYYLINENRESISKRKIPLYLQMSFYVIVGILFALIFNKEAICSGDIIRIFVPIYDGNWYFVTYFILLFFVPYINMFLLKLNKKEYIGLLLTTYIVFFVFNTLTLGHIYITNLFFMIAMYMIGAYISIFHKDIANSKKYLIISIVFAIVMMMTVYIADFARLLKNGSFVFSLHNALTNYYSILSLGFVVFIFIYVISLPVSNNKIINTLASTIGGIYLFHDNNLSQTIIWRIISPNTLYFDNPYLHVLCKITAIFVIGVVLDLFRQLIYKKLLRKRVTNINNYIEKKRIFIENKLINKI